MARMSEEVESDLFLSAAHGNLENVEQLLSSGRVAASISLDISRDEFSAGVQAMLRAGVGSVLGSDVEECDVGIVSVSEDLVALGAPGADGKGLGQMGAACIAVSLSIKASNGNNAEEIKSRMEKASFLKDLGAFLGAKIRTVSWNVRQVAPPKALKYDVDDKDKIGCTAMHWAALNDRCDIIKALVRHKADVNLRGNDGHSPLHWAALKGNLKAAHLLLANGADANAPDNWDFTPIIRASQNGHVLVVLLLLQEGADPLAVDNEKHSCLHWAVYHRHHIVVHWLLKQASLRANINDVDSKGATALHLAARKSGREMIRKLLAVGAQPDIVDADGNTPEQASVAAKRLGNQKGKGAFVCAGANGVAQAAVAAKRLGNQNFLSWYRWYPQALRYTLVQRGEHNRAYTIVPTFHGGLSMVCIMLAYVFWASVLLESTWGKVPGANVLLLLCTPPMYYCFWRSWKADPGTILSQPEAVIKGLISEELAIEDVILVAMSVKCPRAKYSRFFDCYVARFDHDCPWISNVVGAGNHLYFVGFCITCSACLTVWAYICAYHIGAAGYENMLPKCRMGGKTDGSLRPGCPTLPEMAVVGVTYEKVATTLLIIYIIYAIFTWCMSGHQLSQVLKNVTTNEMINWHRYPGWQKEDGSFVNPYDRGMAYNFRQFLASYPSCPRGGNVHAGEYAEMTNLLRDAPVVGGGHGHGHGHGHSHEHGGQCCQKDHVIEVRGDAEGVEMSEDVRKQLRDIGFDDD